MKPDSGDPGLIAVQHRLQRNNDLAFSVVKGAAVVIVASAIITFAVSSFGLF